MNATVIGVFGRTNSGKSSVVNLLLGQDYAIVSRQPGTTTDPVRKRMEIPGMGPCQIIDTAGLDDEGDLGLKRVGKSREIFRQVDIALLLFTANHFDLPEEEALRALKKEGIPVLLLHNQSDIIAMDPERAAALSAAHGVEVLEFSCSYLDPEREKGAVQSLLDALCRLSAGVRRERPLFEDLFSASASKNVLLVCPIDSQAPQGRLILPQVRAIREILDLQGVATVLQPSSLKNYLETGPAPDLVVTDSSIFSEVAALVPEHLPLTSFSMLLARSKGPFEDYRRGTVRIPELRDGDRILILESCTHHASCEDIGRVKLPALFRRFTRKELEFDIVSGLDTLSRPVGAYALVVQCGGCMVTAQQLRLRLQPAIEAGIPVTNYGMAIAFMSGVYERTVGPLLP